MSFSRSLRASCCIGALLLLAPSCTSPPNGTSVSPTEASHTAVEAPPTEQVPPDPTVECDAAVRARYPLNRGLVRAATRKPVPPYPSMSVGTRLGHGSVLIEVL